MAPVQARRPLTAKPREAVPRQRFGRRVVSTAQAPFPRRARIAAGRERCWDDQRAFCTRGKAASPDVAFLVPLKAGARPVLHMPPSVDEVMPGRFCTTRFVSLWRPGSGKKAKRRLEPDL